MGLNLKRKLTEAFKAFAGIGMFATALLHVILGAFGVPMQSQAWADYAGISLAVATAAYIFWITKE